MSLRMWTTSLSKVGLPIFEWATLRLFVHPKVEIIALLSMDSSYIFANSFLCSIVSMSVIVNYYISEYVNYFIDKSWAAHLWVCCKKAVCLPRVEIIVLLSMDSTVLQAATILVAMASGKNIWQLKFQQKSPISDQQKKREKIINNRANLINSTSSGITCLSLFPSRHSETQHENVNLK